MLITFTKKEAEEIAALGRKRHYAKDASFRNNTQWHEGSARSMAHEIGILGEAAYGKCAGLEIDRNIYEVRDDGMDFKDIEVKTVTYFGAGEPELKIPAEEWTGKHKDVKKFVLARLNPKDYTRVEVLGEISREQFDRIKTKKIYRPDGPLNYIAKASQLSPVQKQDDDFGF